MSAASRTGRWCGWTSIFPCRSPAALAAGTLEGQRQISRPVDTAKLLSEQHPKLAMIVLLAGRDAISMSGSEEHTSELQSLMRTSYAVFCLKKKTLLTPQHTTHTARQNTHNNTSHPEN